MSRSGTVPHSTGDPFVPVLARVTAAERVALVLLLMVALFLRVYRLSRVPPGIHDDEVINVRLADQLRTSGGWSVYYQAGEGREGLYYPLLVGSRALIGRAPLWYRLPSVACSLLTLLLVHRLARRWFGPWAALVALGGLAVAFWPLHLGRETLRVVTFPPLAAGMVLALWRGLERPAWDRRTLAWYVLAGFLLGLAQYTYLAARVLPLFLALFAGYLAWLHPARLRAHWRGWVVLLALGALVAAPLALYLLAHWAQQERLARLGGPLQELLQGNPRPVAASAIATLGMFVWRGDPQTHYNLPGRPVFDVVSGALFVVGVLVAWLRSRRPAYAFCWLWTAVLLLPAMLTQPAPHFVRASGALVTAFIFPGLAVRELVRVFQGRGLVAVAVGLVALLGVSGVLTYRDYFERWPDLSEVRAFHHADLAESARYLDRAPDATPVAVCTPFLNETHYFWRSDRQALPYLLNRSDLAVGWYNCQEAQLFLGGGQAGRYLFANELDFAPFVPADWVRQARVLATFDDSRLLSVAEPEAIEAWLGELDRPAGPSRVWSGALALAGYRLETATCAPGDTVELLTAWQVLDGGMPVPYDLAIFVHVPDAEGQPLAQGDALSALSDTLRPGDVFVQQHRVALPPNLPAGDYPLRVGLYVRGGARLRLDSGQGDSVELGPIEVRQ